MNSNMLFTSTCLSGKGLKAKKQHSAQQQETLVSERVVNIACPLLQFNLLDLSEKTCVQRKITQGTTHAHPAELIKNRFVIP